MPSENGPKTERLVRREESRDRQAVRRIHESAFGQPAEANLVDALRESTAQTISFVAEIGGETVGHILFSDAALEPPDDGFRAMGLAPLAVLPSYQRQGVGSELVRRGLTECRTLGYNVVVVLGHVEYYPRFGFVPARTIGLTCEFTAPDDAFMALELSPGGLKHRTGVVRYRPEFSAFE